MKKDITSRPARKGKAEKPAKPARRRSGKKDRNAGLRYLTWAIAVALDALTAAMLWRYEPDHVVAVMESVVCVLFTLAGLVVAENASRMKIDPRPLVRCLGEWAAIICLSATMPTTVMGGGAMAMRMQDRSSLEAATSDEVAIAKQVAADPMADAQAKLNAAAITAKAVRPTQVRIADPAYIGGVLAFFFMAVIPMVLLGVGSLPAAETATQRRARVREENARLKALTEVEVAKASRPGWFRGVFSGKRYPAFQSPDARRRTA